MWRLLKLEVMIIEDNICREVRENEVRGNVRYWNGEGWLMWI